MIRRVNPNEALSLGLDALTLARQDGITRLLVNVCMTVGRVYSQLSNHREAISLFEEAVTALETFREEGGDSKYRAELSRYYRNLYEDLIESLEACDVPPDDLWWTVERSAGRTLIENMGSRGLIGSLSKNVVVEHLARNLPPWCVLLQLYQAGREIRCLALRVVDGVPHIQACSSRLSFLAFARQTTAQTGAEQISVQAHTPASPREFHIQLAWLGEHFLEPLLKEIELSGVTRVIVAAQGFEASLAWHAIPLSSGSPTLGHRFDVVQIPNASILAQLIGRPSRPITKAVFVACDLNRTLTRHIEETLQAFSTVSCKDKIVLLDTSRQISCEAVISACQEADLLHFSGHGVMTQGDMNQTGMVLSDGILTVSRLERELSSRVPSLVVLSSCNSAADDLRLEAVPTLSTAFLQAGVRCVVGAAWPVPDDIAAETTQTFYELLTCNGPVASLNAARRRLRTTVASDYVHSFKVMGWD